MKVPTDLQIIKAIYRRHAKDYLAWKDGNTGRSSKNYVPVDINGIAEELGVDVDIVWGRLYYDLDNRYSYQKQDDSWVHLFTPRLGKDENCIHFPYLVSVLASMKSKRWEVWVPSVIAGIALFVAALSLGWTVRSDLRKEESFQQEPVQTAVTPSESATPTTQAKQKAQQPPSEKKLPESEAPRPEVAPNQPIKPTPESNAPSSGNSSGAAYR